MLILHQIYFNCNRREVYIKGMKKIGVALGERSTPKKNKHISTEFQNFGIYIADCLDDAKHYALYIKLAKTYPRGFLEEALTYAKAYTTAKSKAKIFMWRLKQLKKDAKQVTS